jgi:hypothetical protein
LPGFRDPATWHWRGIRFACLSIQYYPGMKVVQVFQPDRKAKSGWKASPTIQEGRTVSHSNLKRELGLDASG